MFLASRPSRRQSQELRSYCLLLGFALVYFQEYFKFKTKTKTKTSSPSHSEERILTSQFLPCSFDLTPPGFIFVCRMLHTLTCGINIIIVRFILNYMSSFPNSSNNTDPLSQLKPAGCLLPGLPPTGIFARAAHQVL